MSDTHPADTRVVSLADLLSGAVAAAPVARLPLGGPAEERPGDGAPGEESPTAPTAPVARLATTPEDAPVAPVIELDALGAAGSRRRARRRAAPGGGAAREGGAPQGGADPEAVARAICLRLLTERAHTRDELARALRRKGVPDDAAAGVLGRFDEVGLIDDHAFAEQWVRSRHTHRGLGRRALAVELRRKGVADEIAVAAVAAVDDESEERRARELVERRVRSLRTETPELRAAAGRKLVGMLARKGYGGGVAYRVVREVLAECGAEVDELGAELPSS